MEVERRVLRGVRPQIVSQGVSGIEEERLVLRGVSPLRVVICKVDQPTAHFFFVFSSFLID